MSASVASAPSGLKPQYGWSVRALLPITPAGGNMFLRFRVSANAVSILSFLVFAVGLAVYVLANQSTYARAAAAFCFVVGTYLDVVDGYVARLSGATGNTGAYLDAGIDLVRYNLFMAAVWYVTEPSLAMQACLLMYGVLLNLSFVRLLKNIGVRKKVQEGNEILELLLPESYRRLCLRWKLLYNPFNLEDQLLFFLFTLGIAFGLEQPMLAFCTAVRLAEVSLIAVGRTMRLRS